MKYTWPPLWKLQILDLFLTNGNGWHVCGLATIDCPLIMNNIVLSSKNPMIFHHEKDVSTRWMGLSDYETMYVQKYDRMRMYHNALVHNLGLLRSFGLQLPEAFTTSCADWGFWEL